MKAQLDSAKGYIHLISETPEDIEDLERFGTLFADYFTLRLEKRRTLNSKGTVPKRELVYRILE
jgi:hypothetical protein